MSTLKYNNWVPDQNRFKLAGPPEWWLRGLYEFDRSLVVIPSRQACVYRLAQRRPLKLPDHLVNDALFKESDTKMLASYGLIPVTSILATAIWSPFMFEELHRRAPWRQFKNSEEAAKAVEDQDAKDELDRQARTDEANTSLAKDAWGLYLKKIGLRTHMWSPKTTARKPSIILP